MKFPLRVLWFLAAAGLGVSAHAAQSIALYGETKYKPGFQHFGYVNPDAPKGGTLRLSSPSSFDSLNAFILKGVSAPGSGLLYQSLMTGSYDEPQSYYPLIAESITLAPDRSYADFTLNPKAVWHDGKAITADDVVFSFDILRTKGHPSYKVQLKPITVEKTGERSVRIHFADRDHRELPLIAAALPILPKHYYDTVAFEKTTLSPPLGSGPYKVASVDAGRSVTYARVKDYWAASLPSQRGLNNFDTIRYDIYRDDTAALEGLKSHQFDFYEEFIARNWATAYDVPAVRSGQLIKTRIRHKIPRGMQGFIFNTREPKFADVRVREAIGLTLDFEWMNETLFYGAYERGRSYFNNTEFEARGLPDAGELKLLEPFREDLPQAVFTSEYRVPTTDGTGIARDNLIRAQQLLNEAGWVMKDGARVNRKTGEKLTVEFLVSQRTFERVVSIMRHNLAKLGIASSFRYVDSSQYQKRVESHTFDIVSVWWNQGLFYPSTEQYLYWHSSQAAIEGGQNLGGIRNPAVDDLVMRIQNAQSLEQLRPAARALDRVLMHEHYIVPHWNLSAWRIAYWNQFGRPKITPAYNIGYDSWWALRPGEKAPDVASEGSVQ